MAGFGYLGSMFTGLVQAMGTVKSADSRADGVLRLTLDLGAWAHRPSLGDSIAVDGCCLTAVAAPEGGVVSFDVIPQTLAVTTLASLKPGQRVNLEHAATLSTYLGGHVVQGHVDGVGIVERVSHGKPGEGGDWRVTVRVPSHAAKWMIAKGSVCLAGVSLTLAEVSNDGSLITVALIPTTLGLTNLAELAPGQGVNIEADALTKTVVATVQRMMENRQ
ncbi:MAG: riboflavin synthase [Phycisphaerales bacterium]